MRPLAIVASGKLLTRKASNNIPAKIILAAGRRVRSWNSFR